MPRDFGYLMRPAAQVVAAYQVDAHTLEGGNNAPEAIARILTEYGYQADDPVLTDLLLAFAHISSKMLDEAVALAVITAPATSTASTTDHGEADHAEADQAAADDALTAVVDPTIAELTVADPSTATPGEAAADVFDQDQLAERKKELLRAVIATFNEQSPLAEFNSDAPLIVAEYTKSRRGWRVDVSTINKGNTIVRGGECSGPPQAYKKAQSFIEQITNLLDVEHVQVRHQVEGQEAGFRRWAAVYGW